MRSFREITRFDTLGFFFLNLNLTTIGIRLLLHLTHTTSMGAIGKGYLVQYRLNFGFPWMVGTYVRRYRKWMKERVRVPSTVCLFVFLKFLD
jgi:hypothetical protein